MYEILLKLLGEKFPQARKDGLSHLARSLALQVTDETEAQAFAEKLENTQITEYIKNWRKEVDSEIAKGTSTYEETLKSKYDFVEKKKPTEQKPVNTDPTDIASIVANAVSEAMKPLTDKIQLLESGKVGETRRESLANKMANAPESFKKTILKNFAKMNFESDEDFESFLVETEEDAKEFTQESANAGLNFTPKPIGGETPKPSAAISSDIANWANANKTD